MIAIRELNIEVADIHEFNRECNCMLSELANALWKNHQNRKITTTGKEVFTDKPRDIMDNYHDFLCDIGSMYFESDLINFLNTDNDTTD